MSSRAPRVVVVGAGIVGTCVAYYLARDGARVTLIDRDTPGRGVTARAFGWINVCHYAPVTSLRRQAVSAYHKLDTELGHALPVSWCGALTWSREPAQTEQFVRDQMADGLEVRLLERDETATLEPQLKELPSCAAFAASEGAIEPVEATRVVAGAAAERGARVLPSSGATGLVCESNRITGVHTDAGVIAADIVVLAAATGAKGLIGDIGLDLAVDVSPAILIELRTRRRVVNTIVSNPGFEVRQADDTTCFVAEDYIDESDEHGPPAVAAAALETVRTAVNLFRRSTENDRTFVQSLSLDVMPVWYWTDANDWCLTADPMDIPCIEIGFLAGREEPELFVQDMPTSGSMFTHDKVTYSYLRLPPLSDSGRVHQRHQHAVHRRLDSRRSGSAHVRPGGDPCRADARGRRRM